LFRWRCRWRAGLGRRGTHVVQQAAAKKGKGFRVERGAVCGEAPVAGRTL
jgi:hypothetical protein